MKWPWTQPFVLFVSPHNNFEQLLKQKAVTREESVIGDYGAWFGCERLRVPVPAVPMLWWKLSVLEIPLDKELTADCLMIESRTVMVDYGL